MERQGRKKYNTHPSDDKHLQVATSIDPDTRVDYGHKFGRSYLSANFVTIINLVSLFSRTVPFWVELKA
jgi:hypothetical protein